MILKEIQYFSQLGLDMENKFISLGDERILKLYNPDNYIFDLNNNYTNKPTIGFWSSPYWRFGKYLSDWHRWINEEDFHLDKFKIGMIFELKDTAKIYTINNCDDLKYLIDTYPLKNNPLNLKFFKLLDFKDISDHYV